MPVLNIAMVGSDSLAKEIAKASDQRDVHTYVHKEIASDGSQRILSLIRPAKFPERLRPLLGALGVARAGLLEITEVNAALGEALIAFSSSGIKNGIFVINTSEGGWVDEGQVKLQVALKLRGGSTVPSSHVVGKGKGLAPAHPALEGVVKVQ